MEDDKIIQLLFARDERAVKEIDMKYRRYLFTVAQNILVSREDSEECINDVYMSAWKSIPPNRPDDLKLYLVRMTKNRAISMLKHSNAKKRGGGQYNAVLEELEDMVEGNDDPEKIYLEKLTKEKLQDYLRTLPELDRVIFVRRYWYLDKSSDIARRCNLSEVNVKVRLHRVKKKMKNFLKESEGGSV